jgi:hypothetical protein
MRLFDAQYVYALMSFVIGLGMQRKKLVNVGAGRVSACPTKRESAGFLLCLFYFLFYF